MELTKTAIGFTTVAFEAKQLNVRSIAAASAGIGLDVIVFQIHGTATTLTPSAITGIDDLFGGGRNVSALRKTEDGQ